MIPKPSGRTRVGIIVGALIACVCVAVAVVLTVAGSSKPTIDSTQVGGTLTGDRLKQVLGHLFDGVNAVHVQYAPDGAKVTATAAADVVCGPPVQAKITLTTVTTPPQTGTVIIKDNKAYLNQPGFGSKWVLMSSADDGVSSAPVFCQTAFDLRYLGPKSVGTFKGSTAITGISTREYVLSVGTAASNALPSAPAVPVSTTQVVATVWIDNSGRLIQYTYSPTGQGDWVTATYSKWGESVSIQAPPPKDVNVVANNPM